MIQANPDRGFFAKLSFHLPPLLVNVLFLLLIPVTLTGTILYLHPLEFMYTHCLHTDGICAPFYMLLHLFNVHCVVVLSQDVVYVHVAYHILYHTLIE